MDKHFCIALVLSLGKYSSPRLECWRTDFLFLSSCCSFCHIFGKKNKMTDKPFGVSYSKMSCFRRCKQRFHWNYIDKYFSPSSLGQVRGSSGHAALAVWHVEYNADAAMQAAWDKWSSEGQPDGEEWQILENALNRYFQWSAENDTFKLLEAEKKFDISYTVNDMVIVLTGYIDGVVEEAGQLWLLENKFYKRMDDSGLDMDQQVSTYLLAAHTLYPKVNGVIYNMVRVGDTKVAEKEPVVRKRIYRNPEGLKRIESEMLAQVKEMLHYLEGGEPYRNATKDCHWDCSYYSACLSMLDDGQEPKQILQALSEIRSTDG